MKNEKRPIEILLLGKTQTGKSSLINYIFGLEGEKITFSDNEENGIFCKSGVIDGICYNLYDSVGFEATNHKKRHKWEVMIKCFFGDTSLNPPYFLQKPENNFCHTIFYCIASSSLLEDCDIDFSLIESMINNYNQKITVVLTKCDGVDKNKVYKLQNILYEKFGDNISVIKTITKNKDIEDITGVKRIIKSLGISQAKSEIFLNFLKTMIIQLPKQSVAQSKTIIENRINEITIIMANLISNLENEYYNKIENGIYNFGLNQKSANKELQKQMLEDIKPYEDRIKQEVENFNNLVIYEINNIDIKVIENFNFWMSDLKSLTDLFHIDIKDIYKSFNSNSYNDLTTLTSINEIKDFEKELKNSLIKGGAFATLITTLIVLPEPITTAIGIGLLGVKVIFDVFVKDKKELHSIRMNIVKQVKQSFSHTQSQLMLQEKNIAIIEKTIKENIEKSISKFVSQDIIEGIRKKAILEDGIKN